jgi:hypothetical protein
MPSQDPLPYDVAHIGEKHTKFWLENLKVRPRHRWEDNIRMYHREIGWEVVDWTHLGGDGYQW